MRHGVAAPDDLVLARKTSDPEVLSQLAEIELQLYRLLTERSGARAASGPPPSRGQDRD